MNIAAYRSAVSGGKFFRGEDTLSLHAGAEQSTEGGCFCLVFLGAAAIQPAKSTSMHMAFLHVRWLRHKNGEDIIHHQQLCKEK